MGHLKKSTVLVLTAVLLLTIGCSSSNQSSKLNEDNFFSNTIEAHAKSEFTDVFPNSGQEKSNDSYGNNNNDEGYTTGQSLATKDIDYSEFIRIADSYIEKEDYAAAHRELTRAAAEYPNHEDLAAALSKCEQRYIKYALQKAEDIFENSRDYNAAISVLLLAQVDLPNSQELYDAIEKYSTYRPIELKDVMVFYEEDGGIEYHERAITDNIGTEYNGYYNGEGGSNVYRIDGKYTTLQGVAFVPEKYKSRDSLGRIVVYGDGRVLFDTGKMGKGIVLVRFSVDIENVVELRIENTGYVYLAEMWLQKDLNT